MNKEVCKRFKNIWDTFPDELDDSGDYQFKDNNSLNNNCNNNNFSNNYCNINTNDLSSFCNDNISQSDLNKISAGCLYLLDELIKNCGVVPSPAKNNINIVDYILIWLSYMIKLKYSKEGNIITCFSSAYIHDCDKYNKKIDELTDYKDYKDIIDKKWYLLDMDNKIVSKFYKAFKLLCEMYTEFDENKEDCTNRSKKARQFVEKYEELYKDYNSNKYSSYKQVLCTLSTDYDNLIKKCNDDQYCKSSPLPTIETEKIPENCSEETSEKTHVSGYEELYGEISEVALSESSLVSKLIPICSILVAIAIFLGISYKYSLFGFRKRFQKQKLREKLKNIKKRMNH
ncbi:PIR protein [Plasmodium yoelii]|uniref:PIR protein n=2 Tax=Plasmodium yoelii TaxID=5861 RepID=A0AAE9WIW6_PLAYO|nr:PIR protein [Plasmodium yoelii]WBY54652.1 PIR protein [Plasmodium yoelii yoelii]CDU16021.1 YIR protein [Plasmodium yoelii]VTZ71645.1 PIR protein [Plasmodium yoelii]|eukprot:XP_022810970.1 PIR protein [Plasmodium yoelii]